MSEFKPGDYAVIRNPEPIPDGHRALDDMYVDAIVRIDGGSRIISVTIVVEGRASPYLRSFGLPSAYLVPLSPAVIKVVYGLEVSA